MSGFLDNVLAGLSARPKTLPSKYLYDEAGSRLFDEITRLTEYYPTRVETELLKRIAPALSATIPSGAALVEFGSGSSAKTTVLLDAAPQVAVYAPIDISVEALEPAAARLAARYPALEIEPVVADFTHPFRLPEAARDRLCIGFFPGSTIGNFGPEEAVRFLADAKLSLGSSSTFIVGFDLVKDRATLIAAYDDAQGVTAAFDRNMLVRINRELGADFDVSAFEHQARWNADAERIEMHLVSAKAQTVRIAGRRFDFDLGETICTETSHKYRIDGFERLAQAAGWTVQGVWTSSAPAFAVALLAS